MILMTLDHVGDAFGAGHFSNDSAGSYEPGSPLPAAWFFMRWVSHLCAPVFLFLAGLVLALSVARKMEKNTSAREIDKFLLTRGLFIALLDPLWFIWFWDGHYMVLQVAYAIGMSLMAMAFLRLAEEIGNPDLFTGRAKELSFYLDWAEKSKDLLSKSGVITSEGQ